MADQLPEERRRVVRQPAVAGMFYPASKDRLGHEVDTMLEEAPAATLSGRIVGLIEPHAGYIYSGAVAAAGYRLLAPGSIEHVFLIGPSHRAAVHRPALRKGPEKCQKWKPVPC